MSKTVAGIAASDEYLFLAHPRSHNLEVYDMSTLTYQKEIHIKSLLDPFDIVYCYNSYSIFISERDKPLVHRMNLEDGTTSAWKVESESMKLSTTETGNVLATKVDSHATHCYTPVGERINTYNFRDTNIILCDGAGDVGLCHAVQLLDDTVYAVGHESREYSLWRLGERTSSIEPAPKTAIALGYHNVSGALNQPCHMLVDNDKILIADKNNDRILRVDPALEITEDIIPSAAGLKRPFTFCLGEDHQNIYVVDDANKILMFDFEC